MDLMNVAINMTRASKVKSLCPSLETEREKLNDGKATTLIVKIPFSLQDFIQRYDKYKSIKSKILALRVSSTLRAWCGL